MDQVSFVKSSLSNIKHGFFTRHGGVSSGKYESLNVGKHVGDKPEHVDENRRRALAALHLDVEDFVFLSKLEHGTRVYQVDEKAAGVELSDHDVLMTNRPRLALGISTADCLPIVLVDESQPALALVHAGWRGLRAGVVTQGVQALEEIYGVQPSHIKAMIGPSISPDSYEVGPEVAEQFDEQFVRYDDDQIKLDLWAIAEDQMKQAGISQIENLAIDTLSDKRFYSYRRDGETGRFLTVASL